MELELRRDGRTALVETMGGELVSYRDEEGVEYIWTGDERYWRGRNPLLFPIVGAAKDGHLTVGEHQYPMAQHGFARRWEFTLVERGVDWCELELSDDEETRKQYPFAFRLRVRQTLGEGGFTTRISVFNPGEGELPFCVGAHTAFRCPLRPGERYEDYELVFDEEECLPTRLVVSPGYISDQATEPCLENTNTLTPDHALFDRLDTVVLEGLRSTAVSLRHRESGGGVRVEYGDFPMLAFWTMPGAGAPYLCIEPWQGCAHVVGESGALREKLHCVRLAPGATREFAYTVMTLSTK